MKNNNSSIYDFQAHTILLFPAHFYSIYSVWGERETSESSSHRMIKNTFFHPFAKWHTHHRYKLSIECGMRWNLLSLSTLAADPPWLSFFLFFLFFKTDTTFPIIFFHLFSVNCWAMWSAYTQWNSSEALKWDEENVEIWNSTCHAIQPTNPSACVLFSSYCKSRKFSYFSVASLSVVKVNEWEERERAFYNYMEKGTWKTIASDRWKVQLVCVRVTVVRFSFLWPKYRRRLATRKSSCS